MDLEGIIVSEINQREKYILNAITYTWNLKDKQMSITEQKQTHRYREKASSCHWG